MSVLTGLVYKVKWYDWLNKLIKLLKFTLLKMIFVEFPGLQNKKCQESLILECEDKTEAAGCEDREEFIMNV